MSLIDYDQGRIAQSENGPTSLTVALGGTMNLSQLNYFKKLAEVLHYTRAAQELFITQPTLSGAISSLEKELGAPLFERNGRSVLLTPYGEVFYEHVCLALRAIDDGVAAVSARSSASFGTVNLGTTFTTQDHYLPSLIRDFEEAFDKRVIVKVSQGFTNYLTEQLHRGTLDVAFCGKRDNEPDIAYFPVKHCELALYVRDDHPLASADTITFAELNEVDLHTYRRAPPSASAWRRCSRRPTCAACPWATTTMCPWGRSSPTTAATPERLCWTRWAPSCSATCTRCASRASRSTSTRCIWPTTRSTCTPGPWPTSSTS